MEENIDEGLRYVEMHRGAMLFSRGSTAGYFRWATLTMT